ncbi:MULTISPECIES: metabolite traffic protein EboE [Dyadobacter]|uniref:Metabolite traffic protein EboE n=1 Tax=Dyadobacter chenhuakuii TaxID=2909339 RepID=A0ABY4XKE3_9BACT|nr:MULTISPECIES: metabolite traffic protein EboE [Dyadobacter]MCF2493583.1 metabolite traffic protein EboE [Dyadobacter chenhuakuii]MCF2517829.1 metabolite traffic protein EboE [Dyadobacter sp. CY351]USJ30721.1 metabolite traffic protein EboE [Dyadobacter chenhuakuii]
MITPYGHLTYCSNIHPGEKWADHFKSLQDNIPYIREQLAPGQPFGLGLRVANEASVELSKPEVLQEFKNWLNEQDVYVFVINGFPYGGFHNTVVKDNVHTPDWTTTDRLNYTIRLFNILSELLPEGMHGGVSTPPLSYRLWWTTMEENINATEQATDHILQLLDELIKIEKTTGKLLHLDIEPEPDGILDNAVDFVKWYRDVLLPRGTAYLSNKYNATSEEGRDIILKHIQLCYDICHAAVGYENPEEILASLDEVGIQVGRIQVSSALKVNFSNEKEIKLKAIETFDEPVYLHQVVALNEDETKTHYPDLKEALTDWNDKQKEWRVHFHVPLFIHSYGVLESTQGDIIKTLAIHRKKPFSAFLEVETYTWGVLPEDMQKPIGDSIVREIEWVKKILSYE